MPRVIVWAVHLALPVAGLWLLLTTPGADVLWQHHGAHFWLVATVAAVNVAIGVAGIPALADYRGQHDPSGYELRSSILAIADELAAAAELVMHKIAARPVAVIRGYQPQATGSAGTARDLVMPEERNLFP